MLNVSVPQVTKMKIGGTAAEAAPEAAAEAAPEAAPATHH
jgi:hypothetical protein